MLERDRARRTNGAIAIVMLVSTTLGTELAFEIKDDRKQDACLAGTFDHLALNRLDVSLRDEHGHSYAKSTTSHGGWVSACTNSGSSVAPSI